MTKDTKSQDDSFDEDSDDDSLTRFMTPEVRRRIRNKRKRNEAILNKLKTQIDNFDSTKKISEGSSNNKRNQKKKVSQKNETISKEVSSNNDLQRKKVDKNVNEEGNQEQKENSEQEYEIEHICNHMRKRNTMLLLIKWKGYEHPTWEPEDVIRSSINDDVETYWQKIKLSRRQVDTEEKKKKRKDSKLGLLVEKVPMCQLNHNVPTNFYQSMNAWEVERNSCSGKDCSIDFGIQKCSQNNVAWICEGQRRHICNVVYCNKCFFNEENIVQRV